MDIFSVNFSVNELQFIRQSLDLVTIKGSDAKFLAGLQIKIETELLEIQQMMQSEEQKKKENLEQVLAHENAKKSK